MELRLLRKETTSTSTHEDAPADRPEDAQVADDDGDARDEEAQNEQRRLGGAALDADDGARLQPVVEPEFACVHSSIRSVSRTRACPVCGGRDPRWAGVATPKADCTRESTPK